MGQALLDRLLAPGEIDLPLLRRPAAISLGSFEQPVGRVLAAVEDHILDQLAELGIDVVVERELAGIDDAHIHAGLDGVVQEHRMHGLAHALVAAESEGEIGDAAGDMDVRQLFLDAPRRVDESAGIIAVLLDAGGDGEDVGIEDDVLGREAHRPGEEVIGALADLEFPLSGLGLALLVEGHDHHGSAVAADFPGVVEKGLLAFLHADRIDDGLALHAFQASLDHRPFR